MKKAILLLHGFKRNDVDDFEGVREYIDSFGADKVYNEVWFNNYDKSTLNLKHFDKRVNEVADMINKDKPEELMIIAYSTGNIFASNVMDKLNDIKISYFGAAPPFKAHILKWRTTLKKMKQVEKDLIKKLGKERYARLKKAKQDSQVSEKYPVKIIFFMFRKVIRKRKQSLMKIKNAKFLIAKDDHIVKTHVAVDVLSKNGTNDLVLREFTHDLILGKEKQIFIDWMNEVNK